MTCTALFYYVRDDADRDKKIDTIKEVRRRTQCGLKEAKDYVESVWYGNYSEDPIPYVAVVAVLPVSYYELNKPVDIARITFIKALHTALAETNVDPWIHVDLINNTKRDLQTMIDYLNLMTQD